VADLVLQGGQPPGGRSLPRLRAKVAPCL
jgi:hypothetical protein